MDILGIIPARYASTRFPGKPLADISGKSLIQRVYEQSRKAACLKDLIVATDDQRILEHVLGFGGQAVMTSEKHRSGTERCKEAIMTWNEGHTGPWEVVINIQGDEPFIAPEQIDLVGELLGEPGTDIGTLVKKITDKKELTDPNVVKVVMNRYGDAMYFSRSPIPFLRGRDLDDWTDHQSYYKHIGIYGYKTDILIRFPELYPSELELAESLEQLRWLAYGLKIRTKVTEMESIAIDTPSDLSKITNIT
jgi:3-deoxy-manno-octulosonate cytidylyltransferase (CMP-KDO synthetase)